MKIGCLGEIPFEVSSEVVQTITDMTKSGASRYSIHDRHLDVGLPEFTGRDNDTISFDIVVSAYLGVDPNEAMAQIETYQQNGTVVPLIIGEKRYGSFRWVVKSYKTKFNTFGRGGSVLSATISISLLEYPRK